MSSNSTAEQFEAVLGIDPGLDGGWALVAPDGELLATGVMPTVKNEKSTGKIIRTVNAEGLATRLSTLTPFTAAIERVHSMPKQGVASTFKFGESYGIVLGVLGALGVTVRHLETQEWPKLLGLLVAKSSAERKRRNRLAFQSTYSALRESKPTSGEVDATLIALAYIRRRQIESRMSLNQDAEMTTKGDTEICSSSTLQQ